MASITIRNLSQEIVCALKLRAAQHEHSIEAEIRVILEEAVHPKSRIKIGSELATLGRRFGGVNLEFTRDRIDDELMAKAPIEYESARRLARLGGSEPSLKTPPRRRAKRYETKT